MRIGAALEAADIYEDSYAECVGILARQRDEARAEHAALREQTRVRDARVEKCGEDEDVLVWDTNEEHWVAAYSIDFEVWVCINVDHDLYIVENPFWRPMPPTPEAKP